MQLTYQDLKNLTNSMTEEQLTQPVYLFTDFDSIIDILADPNHSFWTVKGKRRLTRGQQVAIADLKHIAQL